MEPEFFSGEHLSIQEQPPASYWGTFWESDGGSMSVIAEVKTENDMRVYITECLTAREIGALSHEEAAHLWVRRQIDAGTLPPGQRIDPAFIARMIGSRTLF